jgi:hypothetical protein
MRKQLSTMKRWAMRLVVLITVAVVVMHSARAQEHAAGKDAVAAVDGNSQDATQELEAAKVPDFEPTDEWQDILPGQSIPPVGNEVVCMGKGCGFADVASYDGRDSMCA